MLRRTLATLGIAAAVTGGAVAAAGGSSAEPLPILENLYPRDMAVMGDHAFCRGMVHVEFSYDHAKPGTTIVTFTSPGFTGEGPDWADNPICTVNMTLQWNAGFARTTIPLHLGMGPQEPVTAEIPTGFGVNLVQFNTYGFGVPSTPGVPYLAYTFLPWW